MRDLGWSLSLKKRNASAKENDDRTSLVYDKHRKDFIIWIKNRVSDDHAKHQISYLDRYLSGKIITSPAQISRIRDNASSKKQITIAIRNLLNYCEEMDLLDEGFILKLRKPLKSVRSNPDNYVPNDEKVREAYQKINPKYKVLFKLLIFSGIRATEAIEFFKNYTKDKVEIVGNVARYPLFSLRKNKRSYFVYFPADMINEIENREYTRRGISNAFIRAGLPSKYLRKWNYNFLIMHNVPESVADFIQGRSPISIGSMHYLAKVKQADYWYNKIAEEIVSVLNIKVDFIEQHTLKVKIS